MFFGVMRMEDEEVIDALRTAFSNGCPAVADAMKRELERRGYLFRYSPAQPVASPAPIIAA